MPAKISAIFLLVSCILLSCTSTTPGSPVHAPLMSDAMKSALQDGRASDVMALITNKADANAADENGATVLHGAVLDRDVDLVTWLISHGANVNAKDGSGQTPLMVGAEKGASKIVDVLLQHGADIKAKDNAGLTPLHHAVQGGQSDVVEKLLQDGADANLKNGNGGTILNTAIEADDVEIADVLLRHGAAVSAQDPDIRRLYLWEVQVGSQDMVELLLKSGVDVNVKDGDGNSALYWVFRNDERSSLGTLFKAGIDVNAKNNDGETVLYWAVKNDKTDVVELLMARGADVNVKDKDGTSVLCWSVRNGRRGSAESLLRHGADVNAADGNGDALLHVAAREGRLDVEDFLLGNGADVNAKDANGRTSLFVALQNDHMDIAALLLKHGADVNAADQDGATALQWAAHNNRYGSVNVLLENGADVNARDKDGRTALSWAGQDGNMGIAELLLDRGAESNGSLPRGTPLWARTVSAKTSSILMEPAAFSSVAVDAAGNIYAAGYISAEARYTFEEGVVVQGAAGNGGALLVKYDRTGTALWARTVSTGSGGSAFLSVAVDGSGNILAAGWIGNGTYAFAPGVTAVGTDRDYVNIARNVVLVKYNANGTALWARSASTAPSPSGYDSVAVDAEGNVYAAGAIDGMNVPVDVNAFTFGAGVKIKAASDTSAVLVTYSAAGAVRWARAVAGGRSQFTAVAVDAKGDIYAAGNMDDRSTYTFSPGVTAKGPGAGINLVLARYNSSGAAQWARTVSAGASNSELKSVAVDGNGDVYAAGSLDGTGAYTFAPGVSVTGTAAGANVLLAKYDPSGQAQWARTIDAGPASSAFNAVAVSANADVYAAGYINGTGTYAFGPRTTAAGAYSYKNQDREQGANLVLVTYDSSGEAQKAQTVTHGTSNSLFASVAVDAGGYVYAGGQIGGTGVFDDRIDSSRSYAFGPGVAADRGSDDSVLLVKYTR